MLNRAVGPAITDATQFNLRLPAYQKTELRNSVPVYAIDMGTQDTLMINLIFYAGNCLEEKNLVATAANYLLKSGTSSKNAYDINEYFEYYGAFLNRSSHHETAELTLHCMSKHIAELLPVIAELIADSVLPVEELDIFKKNMQQKLQVNLLKNDFVAGRLIDSYLFGTDHPYGKYSSLEDYAALDRDELNAFYKKYYKEGHCMIFIAGKLPPNIVQEIDRTIGGLPLKSGTEMIGQIRQLSHPAKEQKYHIINDPKGVQGSIRIARNFPNRHHPDFQKMQVLNNVFGGYFGSRLMANIREDKGYTYGIYSYLLSLEQESGFMISTEAGRDVSEATIAEVYKEMQLLCEEPVDDEELHTARSYMIGTLLGDLDGPFHVANRWKNIILNGLDESYFYQGIEITKTISPLELQELANKYLIPDNYYELLVI